MPRKNKNKGQAEAPQYDPAAYSDSYSGYSGYTQSTFSGDGYNGYGSNTYAPTPGYGGYNEPEEEKKKKRGAGFYIGIALIAIALVAGLAVGIIMYMSSTQIVPSHRSGLLGQLDGKTEEEIVAELNRVVEEGMFNIAIANTIVLQNGSSEGQFNIENSPANRYNMQVTISVADTGEVIYQSGVIEPNHHIDMAKLDTPLPKGTYNCIATFHALDPNNNDAEIGQASASITVVVNS